VTLLRGCVAAIALEGNRRARMAAPASPVALPSRAELTAAGLSDDQIASVLGRMGFGHGGSPSGPVGLDITPAPGFVVKSTVDSVDASKRGPGSEGDPASALVAVGAKVFINLASHGRMPAMRKVSKPGEEGTPQEGVHVPVAVGPLRVEKDNAGADCLALDLVVHSEVIGDCDRDFSGAFRHWLVQLALRYVAMKHGLACSPQYALPKLKYKGATVESQRIRVDKSPAISEVGEGEGGPSTPLKLLSEAGALPAASTALALPQAGMAGARSAPPRTPARPDLPATMDIRLVSEEKEKEAGVLGGIARDAASALSSPSVGSLLAAAAGSPATPSGVKFRSEEEGGGAALLSVASTRRLPAGPRPVSVAAFVYGVTGEGEAESTSSPCAVSMQSTEGVAVVAVEMPQGSAETGSRLGLTLILTLPPCDKNGPPRPSGLQLTGKGGGTEVRLAAPGSVPTALRLPFRVAFVSDDGDAVVGQWESASSTVTLHLRRLENGGAALPSLPPSLPTAEDEDGHFELMRILAAYVEVDAGVFEPDTGSRPWLLALALSSEEGGGGGGGRGPTPALPAFIHTHPDSGLPIEEQELPEDAFLRQDAISAHFLAQRAADREEKRKRDAERATQPFIREVTTTAGGATVESPSDIGRGLSGGAELDGMGLEEEMRGGRKAAPPINTVALLDDLL